MIMTSMPPSQGPMQAPPGPQKVKQEVEEGIRSQSYQVLLHPLKTCAVPAFLLSFFLHRD